MIDHAREQGRAIGLPLRHSAVQGSRGAGWEPCLRSIDLAVRRRVLQAEVICVNVDRRGRHLQILGN
ncbi:MAG: hypothetical protein QOI25_3910 [Mycobacterium sp.]|nr:hypothetical protein [Mycobacterium sp.]